MADARVTQSTVLALVATVAAQARVTQSSPLALYNTRGQTTYVTQSNVNVLGADHVNAEITQSNILVLCAGRVATPQLRVWTAKLDGHPWFFLRLGDFKTLVYDLYSQQWVDWHSKDLDFWRAHVGMNWLGARKIAAVYGSNIIAGDDVFGLLWVLDPKFGEDQSPAENYDNERFPRIVSGQIVVRGRTAVPCYDLILTTDKGDPVYDFAPVTLYTSDDGGKTYDDQGSVQVVIGDATQDISWSSLGQMQTPGRLIEIIDDGAIARIDSLDMDEP